MFNKKEFKRHLLYIGIIIGLVILYKLTNITCPIFYFTNIPCPTCGVTRAMFALITGNIEDYMYFHPFALPLIIAVLMAFHIKLFDNTEKWIPYSFLTIVLIGNTIFYGYRLYLYFN